MTDGFFEERKGAAAMKHAILRRYLPVFVGMTGSRSAGNEVYYVDGFAGPGAYNDDQPGSPTIALNLSQSMQRFNRRLCGICIENDEEHFRQLHECLADAPDWQAVYGTAEDSLPLAVSQADNLPLFVFLDPYGLKDLPFDTVANILRRPDTTEVLIRIEMTGIKRIAGHVHSPFGSEATLAVNDAFLGGEWWRELNSIGTDEFAYDVLAGYVSRLRRISAGPFGHFWFPISDGPDGATSYYLVHLAAHDAAFWAMNNAISMWHEEVSTQPDMFDNPDTWIEEIEGNVLELLDEGTFQPRHKLSEVFGSTLGKARDMHVRKALKNLFRSGVISTNPTGQEIPTMLVSR